MICNKGKIQNDNHELILFAKKKRKKKRKTEQISITKSTYKNITINRSTSHTWPAITGVLNNLVIKHLKNVKGKNK